MQRRVTHATNGTATHHHHHTTSAVRRLAYDRALQQHPQWAPLLSFFDALQLHTMCGVAVPAAQMPPLAGSGSYAVGKDGVHVDASTALPSAEQTGAPEAPYRTIHSAVDAVRQRQRGADRQHHTAPIILHQGLHFLNETLSLRPADSFLHITAAAGENAWISGGVELDLVWKRQGRLFVADVTQQAVQDITGLFTVEGDLSPRRLTRARFPNGNWETDQWGLCSSGPCLDIGPAYTTPERWGGDPNISYNRAAAIPRKDVVEWWPPGNKELPTQTPFLNTTQGGAACAPGKHNCTQYEFTLGSGGPCKLWASWDSNPDNNGKSYWCGDHTGGGGAGLDSHMSKTVRGAPWWGHDVRCARRACGREWCKQVRAAVLIVAVCLALFGVCMVVAGLAWDPNRSDVKFIV